MFKNKHMQVRLVEDVNVPAFKSYSNLVADFNVLLEDHLKDVVQGVVLILVTRKALDVAGEVILAKVSK